MTKLRSIVILVFCFMLVFSTCTFAFASELEPTEPTEPTEPSTDDSGFDFLGLGDALKKFGEYLITAPFKFLKELSDSIFSIFKSIRQLITNFADSVGGINDVIDFFTINDKLFKPFADFFDSLSHSAITYYMQIWNSPLLSEFSVGLVAILLIGGIIGLFMTL